MSNRNPETRDELRTAIERLRMLGLAHCAIGVDLTIFTPLSLDELRSLYAKAMDEKSATIAARAERAAREQAHHDATHQTREQAQAREDERVVNLRVEQRRIARENDARRHWIRPTSPAPEPPMAA